MKGIAQSGLWSQPGVPHRGWTCVDVIDLRSDGQSAEETDYATCEMCGNERVRFVHVMEHDDHEGAVEAGCVCAEKMSNDYVNPRKREATLRSRAGRKSKWLTRKWRVSAKGNHFINIDGHNLVAFPAKFKPGRWSFKIDDEFSRRTYASAEEAKLAMFDDYWNLTEEG